MGEKDTGRAEPSKGSLIGRVLAIFFVIAVSASVFFLRDWIASLRSLGYLGAFATMFLGNATIVLPAPGLTVVFALGSALNPILVGLASGVGASLGELTGYLAGYGGRVAIENRQIYQRFERTMKRYGFVGLFVLAVIPNPLFDIAGIAAGALKFTWWRFLLVTWVGKTCQGILVAYAGSISATWVLELLA